MQKILIIEDEPVLREMYGEKFQQAGLEVIAAESAEEGIKKAREIMPDIILLDILLPKDNGIDCLRKIKEDPQIKGLKVLAFSNFDEPRTKTLAKQLGALDYLIKTDYTPQSIVEKVLGILRSPEATSEWH